MKRALILILFLTSIFSLVADNSKPVADGGVRISMPLSAIEGKAKFGFSATEPDFSKPDEITPIESLKLGAVESDSEVFAEAKVFVYYSIESADEFSIFLSSGPFVATDGGSEISWHTTWTEMVGREAGGSVEFGQDDYSRKLIYKHVPSVSIGAEGTTELDIMTEELSYIPSADYEARMILSLVVSDGEGGIV